jgi:hypothetical protein
MPFYLYIKTHNVTGLKYLGQTGKKDPYKYKGSGLVWERHIKKYGYDVTTEIIGIFENKNDLRKVSLEISEREDIVNSPNWANLQPESGDGIAPGYTTIINSDGAYELISCESYDPKIHKHLNAERKYTDEVNKKKGRSTSKTDQTKENISKGRLKFLENGGKSASLGKIWFHSVAMNKELYRDPKEGCPEGWQLGRLPETEQTKKRKSEAHIGKKWYHNPLEGKEACIKSCPQGWIAGRLKSNK